MVIWDFIEKQILGMAWLNNFIGYFLNYCGLDTKERIGASIQFLIYDSIKIIVLLFIFIFVIGYIQSFFPPERTKKILSRTRGISANILSALLGTVTPFCSCSSIPLFIGFTRAGLALGVTFSFLISSPLVDLASFILLMSIFGTKIAVVYVFVGLVLAVLGGTIIEKLNSEKYIESFVKGDNVDLPKNKVLNIVERMQYGFAQSKETLQKVFWYIIIGVSIGAIIHNWIPSTYIQMVLGKDNPFSVFLAVFMGIPMYADIFGTLPVAEALATKGVGIGTILAFMMSVTVLSIPSIMMLKKVIKPRLLMIFVAIVVIGIIIIGFLFNIINIWT